MYQLKIRFKRLWTMYIKGPQSFCIKLFLSARLEVKTTEDEIKANQQTVIRRERKRIMRKNRRDNIRKERIIMVASSAFVLAALTMTGLYMRGQEAKQQDDGYTLDFSALGNNANNNLQEIGRQQTNTNSRNTDLNLDDDLDYMPLDEDLTEEAGSHLVEIPGVTKAVENNAAKPADEPKQEENQQEAESTQTSVELHYSEDQGLTRPVDGTILMPYSMDGGIYFATLDQYKYNPATVFAAEEGADVVSCAEGRVTKIFDDAELGHAVTMELGDGYEVTYGQLTNIQVEQDSYVKAGEKIGTVAAPTKYYTLEGTNLYFKMEKDGAPVNTENLY